MIRLSILLWCIFNILSPFSYAYFGSVMIARSPIRDPNLKNIFTKMQEFYNTADDRKGCFLSIKDCN
jgi:hypothetical protein